MWFILEKRGNTIKHYFLWFYIFLLINNFSALHWIDLSESQRNPTGISLPWMTYDCILAWMIRSVGNTSGIGSTHLFYIMHMTEMGLLIYSLADWLSAAYSTPYAASICQLLIISFSCPSLPLMNKVLQRSNFHLQ